MAKSRSEIQKDYEKRSNYAAIKKYQSKIKRIPLDVNIELFEDIETHIKITGEKRNTFIKRAIKETIERDSNPNTDSSPTNNNPD